MTRPRHARKHEHAGLTPPVQPEVDAQALIQRGGLPLLTRGVDNFFKYHWARYCGQTVRPKFICFTCRRGFKPANTLGNACVVRPLEPPQEDVEDDVRWKADNGKRKWTAYLAAPSLPADGDQDRRWPNANKRFVLNRERMDQRKLEPGRLFLAMGFEGNEPELEDVAESRLVWALLRPRCSGCGNSGFGVGKRFRIPARNDERGWKAVVEMVTNGAVP